MAKTFINWNEGKACKINLKWFTVCSINTFICFYIESVRWYVINLRNQRTVGSLNNTSMHKEIFSSPILQMHWNKLLPVTKNKIFYYINSSSFAFPKITQRLPEVVFSPKFESQGLILLIPIKQTKSCQSCGKVAILCNWHGTLHLCWCHNVKITALLA